MKLYQIPQELEILLDAYSSAITDEERQGIAEKIMTSEKVRDNKVNNIIKEIRNQTAKQAIVKNEIELLKQMNTTSENKVNRLKDFLVMFFPGYKPADCSVPFHWQQRRKVTIQDEGMVPDWCYVTPEPEPPEPKLSIKLIEEQYKDGNEVPGTVFAQVWIPTFPKKAKENKDEQSTE